MGDLEDELARNAALRRRIEDFLIAHESDPMTPRQVAIHFRLDDVTGGKYVRAIMTEMARHGPLPRHGSDRSETRLPRDLQDRLDAILARPVLRRCPRLSESIEVLVRNAYGRRSPSELSGAQRDLLISLEQDGAS